MSHYYTYGLRLHSDVPLPELARVDAGACDVRIRLHSGPPPPDWASGPNEERLSWAEVGTFLVSEGTTVRVFLRDGVDKGLVRLPLLGPVLGTVLHQRGHVVLHASAVAMDGGVVAFVGHKGYGKSTMAAALHARGHPLVTDDLLPVELREGERPRAWPGHGRLSLWPESAKAVGKDPSRLRSLHERVSKKELPAPNGIDRRAALPLKGIYVLGRGDRLACQVLSARAAFVEVLRHSYCPRQLARFGAEALPSLFQRYTRLVETVPVHRLDRPDDLNRLPDIVQVVERSLSGVPVQAPR